ncbi:MAG: flagellar M-ring protein FliF [Gammaproteobacteria bacterium]|nr:flagellar M-ring protein FliF [Gammaproteobacteria bacterium]MCF6362781.1 flagellar M-ring protein FliF [Gammaproteobacteria bacterium]
MARVKTEEMSASFSGLNGLDALRQIGLMIGLAASVAIGVTVVLWSWTPNYGVLYGALAEQDVGTVLDALRQSGIDAKLDETSGAVLVPAADIHSARIKLAAMGLPKGVSAGFEALDKKNTFGISQFMEKARYQRALEIELARTVQSLRSVQSARVHLAVPRQSVFVRNRQKARASVVVNLYPGRVLEKGQVTAIVHMVSSSVPNLETAQVTVVDQKGNLLTQGDMDKRLALSNSQFEYTRRLEKSYIERIEGILGPLLGSNALRAQVTADLDFTASEQTQEIYNPDSAALRSNQTTEESSNGAADGGIPGALTNQPPGLAQAPEVLPPGDAGATALASPTHSRRREIRNFELDKTISHTRYAMGSLQRLSVAVVVDDRVSVDEAGQLTRQQRSPEELERMTELVKKAVGFNTERGDSVNVINSAFTLPAEPAPLPEVPIWEQAWAQDLVKKGIGGLLVLLLVFGVLKPVMKSLAAPQMQELVVANGEKEGDAGGISEDTVSLSQEAVQPALGGPPGSYEQNLATANAAIEQDPKLVAQVVKNWVKQDG